MSTVTYSTWSKEKILIQTYPLKNVLDKILPDNTLVDFDRRINNILNKTTELKQARQLLELREIHDFYSHSNWIEL
ncbi:unnamed protein product, partial [Rotaria magnacalcarata]